MGKGSRVRVSRSAGDAPASAHLAGAAFGLGLDGRRADVSAPPVVRAGRPVDEPPEWDQERRARGRVDVGIEELQRLRAERATARSVVARLDDEIAATVRHVRVDGANWAQVGRALGISRQGARQVFGTRRPQNP